MAGPGPFVGIRRSRAHIKPGSGSTVIGSELTPDGLVTLVLGSVIGTVLGFVFQLVFEAVNPAPWNVLVNQRWKK